MHLSDAGWPRPLNGRGYPVPWYNDYDDLKITHKARYRACASGAICPVCGCGYDDNETAYALLSLRQLEGTPLAEALRSDLEWPLDGHDVSPMDNSVMHTKCCRLALAKCPHLTMLMAENELFVIQLPANSCDVVPGDAIDPRPHGIINGADCTVLARV